MFKNEADFKKIVSRLNIDSKPNPAHRENLRRQMLSTFNETGEQPITQSRPLWRTIMKSPITKIAAAAAIIIAIMVSVYHFNRSMDGATAAFAQMAEALEKMPWMHAVGKTPHADRPLDHWWSFKSRIEIHTLPNGDVHYYDYGKRELQKYDSESNTITISYLQHVTFPVDAPGAQSPGEFLGKWAKQMRDFAKSINEHYKDDKHSKAKIVRKYGKYNGKKAEIYEVTLPSPTLRNHAIEMKIVADFKTHLPIFAETKYIYPDSVKVLEHSFDFPQTGPNNLYELGVPRSAIVKVTDESKQYAADAGSPKLVPIDIKLPRPMFEGTPQPLRVSHWEKPLGRDRPPFLAPVGTKNVAFGKPVTGTDDLPFIGELEMITDGDKEAADGSFVELGPFKQSVTIDLEAEYNIYAILFWHYHKQAVVYFDVVVQVASDPDFITGVTTLFNNDIDNSAGLGVGKDMHYTETNEGKLIDARGARARYVRLYSNGNTANDQNHYIEVEVFAKPAK